MNTVGPILLGLCGAAVIVGGRWVLFRVLERGPFRRAKHATLFGVMCLFFAVGCFVVEDNLLRIGLAVASLFFLWGAVGTVCAWPGFRDPPLQDDGDEEKSEKDATH